jgi:Ca-activated chloride channel family protein
MADEVQLNCLLNVGTVPAGGEPRLVYLLVNVRPGKGTRVLQAPVNMAVVLDVSESMRLPVLTQAQFQELSRSGKVRQTVSDGVPVWTFASIPEDIRRQAPSNLEMVQSAIAQAAGHFTQADRVTLVAFADRAEVLLRGVPGSERRRILDAVSALGNIQLGDGTDMSAGLRMGLEELEREGATQSEREGAPDMVNRVLVLTDGFTRDPKASLELVAQARRRGVVVSTLGIGTEFNENLLVEMADASLGNAYFARVPQEIPPAFRQEVATAQSVVLRHVDIEVRTSTGVEVRRAYRLRPAIAQVHDAKRDERSVVISVGDVHPEQPPALLLEMVVPPQPGGTFRIARVAVSHGGKQVSTSDVVLNYSASGAPVQEQPDPTVMSVVERVSAYVLQTRALDDLASGNKGAATKKLRAAATRLLAVGEAELARTVQLEAERIEQAGEVSPEGAKEMRYATRKLTSRLN